MAIAADTAADTRRHEQRMKRRCDRAASSPDPAARIGLCSAWRRMQGITCCLPTLRIVVPLCTALASDAIAPAADEPHRVSLRSRPSRARSLRLVALRLLRCALRNSLVRAAAGDLRGERSGSRPATAEPERSCMSHSRSVALASPLGTCVSITALAWCSLLCAHRTTTRPLEEQRAEQSATNEPARDAAPTAWTDSNDSNGIEQRSRA